MRQAIMIAMAASLMLVGGLMGCEESGLIGGGDRIVHGPGLLDDPATARLLMNEDDVTIDVTCPHDMVRQGESITLDVTVTNTTDRPVRIDATTTAKLLVHVWEQTPIGMERFRAYPENDAQVMTAWGLESDGMYCTQLTIPVDRYWPTYEPLELTVTINGTRIVSDPISLSVLPEKP
jgi:hypothetical protein